MTDQKLSFAVLCSSLLYVAFKRDPSVATDYLGGNLAEGRIGLTHSPMSCF
jgi:hypothetical protein